MYKKYLALNDLQGLICHKTKQNFEIRIIILIIMEEIYYLLTSCGLFPEEQNGCRKGSRGA